MQKACSYTCAEVLIGHTWLTYLSEARVQPCTHLYTPILQSNKYRKQKPSTRIILRKNMCEHTLTNSLWLENLWRKNRRLYKDERDQKSSIQPW